MTPRHDSDEKLEKNIGAALLEWSRDLVGDPKTWAAIFAGALLVIGAHSIHLFGGQGTDQISADLHSIRKDMAITKVTLQALVDSQPEAQQARTKAMISDRLAVLRIAEMAQHQE